MGLHLTTDQEMPNGSLCQWPATDQRKPSGSRMLTHPNHTLHPAKSRAGVPHTETQNRKKHQALCSSPDSTTTSSTHVSSGIRAVLHWQRHCASRASCTNLTITRIPAQAFQFHAVCHPTKNGRVVNLQHLSNASIHSSRPDDNTAFKKPLALQ